MAKSKPLMTKSSGTDHANEAVQSALRTLEAEVLSGVRGYRYLVCPRETDLEDYLIRFQEHIRPTLAEALGDVAAVRDIPDAW